MSKKPTGKLRPRDMQDATNLLASVLETLQIDLMDENFNGTPERFVKYLLEYNRPFDAKDVLKVGFSQEYQEQGYKGMVVQTNIPWRTICPHHLLPVTGRCHIGYIADKRVVGLSKLTRLAQAVGKEKPRMQETCTDIIADLLNENLGAKGVVVVISAEHGCMYGRGVLVHDTPTITSTVRGLFRDVPAAREEFFQLIRLNHIPTGG